MTELRIDPDDEVALRSRLHKTMDSVDPAVDAMFPGIIASGRRYRRRRTTLRTGGALVGVAATVTVVVVGLGSGGAPTNVIPAATPSAYASAPTTPRKLELAPRTAAYFLADNLGTTPTRNFRGQKVDDSTLEVEMDVQSHGEWSGVDLHLHAGTYPQDTGNFFRCDGGDEPSASASTTVYSPNESCEVGREPDGTLSLTSKRQGDQGPILIVDLLRPDGTWVSLTTESAKAAPLTLAQALTIVSDERWSVDHRPTAAEVAEAKRVIDPWRTS